MDLNVKMTGILPNPKWEAFAQARAKGKSADQAYALAGYRPHRQNAARLMTNDAIKARLAELQGSAAERAMVTVETIADQLDEDRRLAHQKGQASAAVAASMAKAKLYGLDVERVQVESTHRFANLSDEQLRFELARCWRRREVCDRRRRSSA
jgi:phage terminase small subunit